MQILDKIVYSGRLYQNVQEINDMVLNGYIKNYFENFVTKIVNEVMILQSIRSLLSVLFYWYLFNFNFDYDRLKFLQREQLKLLAANSREY